MPAGVPPIRPMLPEDALAVHELGVRVLFTAPPGADEEAGLRRSIARLEHLARSDPGGCWVADGDAGIDGVAIALVRERVWGLSLYAVDEAQQRRGLGRRLLEASLAHGVERAAQGWIILSSEHPAATRSYARAGFDLHPSLSAMAVPDLRRAPDAVALVEDAGAEGIAIADAIGRELRGAGHAPDLPVMLAAGDRLLVCEDRAFAVVREATVMLLGGRDDEASRLVLWAALTTSPPGATAIVDYMTSAQQWAIRTCIEARLPLTPDGPVCTKGRLGPMHPYLPSGAYL